jgi:hypothetical protein
MLFELKLLIIELIQSNKNLKDEFKKVKEEMKAELKQIKDNLEEMHDQKIK